MPVYAPTYTIASTEGKIAYARQYYNDSVQGYNTSIQLDLPSWQQGIIKQTNTSLGRPTGVRDPRKMAMTLRLEF